MPRGLPSPATSALEASQLQMNHDEVSGLLCVGMHGTDGGEESYGAEYPKMDQDTSHETTKFDVVMATSAMCTDNVNTNACLDEYNMLGIQPMDEINFGSAQHFELQSKGLVADSEEESVPSSPETSSTSNYDMPGYMEQNLEHIYNAYDAVVEDGLVVLNPAFIICNETSHLEPNLTFSLDGIKIEYLDLDSREGEKITLQWEISNIISISCKWAQSVGSAFVTLLAGSAAETGNAGPIRVQFCLDDSQWPRRQQKIWELEPRYQEIWNDIPSDDFTSENWSIEPSMFFPRQYFSITEDFEDVIYPKGDPDAVSISKRDAELLLPETFVNDTIIDFYIKFLSTRIESTEKRRYHFFNSFFFRKLADLDKDQGRAPEGRAAFLRVRKWTRKINIFEKDFLFIPVNFSLHWSLIVICYPGEVVTSKDGDTKLLAGVPCILHMDSLKGSHAGLKDIIQSYLWEEWKERHPESASEHSDKFLNLRFVSLELPQQDNSFDCGLFLLHYAELFLMDAPSNFNPLKIDEFSGFLSSNWFAPPEASLKRSVVRKLIHELVTGSFQNHPKLACGSEQLDEKHQRSSNAEPGPAGEFIVQKCSADEPKIVCTVRDGNHKIQPSKSMCLSDSEEIGLTSSGCMLDTGRVSIDNVKNTQGSEVSAADKDTFVCLSSHDEKKEPLIAQSNNQLDMRSCSQEVLKESNCVVTDKEHGESLFFSLDENHKNPSQVQDIMVSTSCAVSEINAQVIASQEHSFQRSAEVGDECFKLSQDMDSVMMLDSNKDDDGPNPERITTEGDCGDPCEDMGSVMLGDTNKDVADAKCEDSLVDPFIAENAIIENVKEISTADLVTIENAIIENVKDISTTANNVDHGELYVSSQLPDGNADNDMTDDGCELKTGSTNNGITGVSTASPDLKEENIDKVPDLKEENIENVKDISTTANNVDHGELYVSSQLPDGNADNDMTDDGCELKTGSTNNGITGVSTASPDLKEENINKVPDLKEKNIDKVVAGDCTHESDVNAKSSSDLKVANTENRMTGGITFSSDVNEGNTDQTIAGDCTNEIDVNADGEGADNYKHLAADGAALCEDDTACTDGVALSIDAPCSMIDETVSLDTSSDAKRPMPDVTCELVDRPCILKNETSQNTSLDGKRPAPDSRCEENDIAIPGDKCIQKGDGHGNGEKIERHYKRRKVLALERQQSFSGATPLD